MPVEVDSPELAALAKPVLVTVLVSLILPLTQFLTSVNAACLRVFVCVQTMLVSAAFTVSVLPLSPLVPVQARVDV